MGRIDLGFRAATSGPVRRPARPGPPSPRRSPVLWLGLAGAALILVVGGRDDLVAALEGRAPRGVHTGHPAVTLDPASSAKVRVLPSKGDTGAMVLLCPAAVAPTCLPALLPSARTIQLTES